MTGRMNGNDHAVTLIVVDEVGAVPSSALWLDQNVPLHCRRAATFEQGLDQICMFPASVLLLAPDAERRRDPAATLQAIALLRADVLVTLLLPAEAGEDSAWLKAGADWVFSPPFDVLRIAPQLRALLRLKEGRPLQGMAEDQASAPLPFIPIKLGNGFTFDPVTEQLWRDGQGRIRVARAELAILTLLARNPGQVVSRDQLSSEALGRQWEPGERSVDRTVMALRRRLGMVSRAGAIRSHRGKGYSLWKGDG